MPGMGIQARVVEYTLADPGLPAAEQRYRLLTTLLDPEQAPAAELAALYRERWELEGAIDELKTTSAAHASCCAQNTRTACSRKPTATSAPTTRSAG